MALLVNKKEIKTVIFNGVSLKELIVNGITVFKRFLGLWVRREMFEESHLNLKETWQLDDHIYYSYSGRHYELDRETNTWVKKKHGMVSLNLMVKIFGSWMVMFIIH